MWKMVTPRAASCRTIVSFPASRKGAIVNSAPEASKDATRKLARFIIASRFEDLPGPVRHEAKRTLLNWVGCAIGGSGDETVRNPMAGVVPFVGPGPAACFGPGGGGCARPASFL